MTEKWTTSSMPDQSGRVAVVTGANTGIGLETAKALALQGASVVLAVRDVDRGTAAADRIRLAAADEAATTDGGAGNDHVDVTVQRLDLASLASIRTAADELRAAHPAIDLLVNNAGVVLSRHAIAATMPSWWKWWASTPG